MVDVLIIGGGLSGLAAAVELTRSGATVALIEQSPKLGGRCYSYRDETTGDIVDNGQHVLVGAYHFTLRYLELIGTRHLLKEYPRFTLPMHHPQKGFSKFEIPSLPRPFDLMTGMLGYKLLSLKDRRGIVNVGFSLRKWNAQYESILSQLTIEQWLTNLQQSDETMKSFWNPIAISIMNEHPRQASALLFARALRAAFFGKKSDSVLMVPTVGQTELYVNGAISVLQPKGVKIEVNRAVENLVVEGSKVVGANLSNGERVQSQFVLSAVPHYALQKLLPESEQQQEQFSNCGEILSSPIVSIHLWFDREFMEMDYIGLIDRDVQWLFNRKAFMREKSTSASYLSAVISGAYNHVDRSKEELVVLALRDISTVFPEATKAKLTHSLVIKEKRATFSPTNKTEHLRSSTETALENFYLAGDWTSTGLPGTIEGAVMSGFRAAELIGKQLIL